MFGGVTYKMACLWCIIFSFVLTTQALQLDECLLRSKNKIEARFSEPTNQARLGNKEFSCLLVVTPPTFLQLGEDTKCQWADSQTLTIKTVRDSESLKHLELTGNNILPKNTHGAPAMGVCLIKRRLDENNFAGSPPPTTFPTPAPMANALYDDTLHFAELYFGDGVNAGVRTFSVNVQQNVVLSDVNLVDTYGHDAAASFKYSEVNVTDGSLVVEIVRGDENPKINAIEVVEFVPDLGGGGLPPQGITSIYINSGGYASDFVQENGNVWVQDEYFSSTDAQGVEVSDGSESVFTSETIVGAFGLNTIYAKARQSVEILGGVIYSVPLAEDGVYEVILYFAELDQNVNASGLRVMDVVIEDVVMQPDFDIFDAAGGYATATTLTNPTVAVQDGVLDIVVTATQGKALISGIFINQAFNHFAHAVITVDETNLLIFEDLLENQFVSLTLDGTPSHTHFPNAFLNDWSWEWSVDGVIVGTAEGITVTLDVQPGAPYDGCLAYYYDYSSESSALTNIPDFSIKAADIFVIEADGINFDLQSNVVSFGSSGLFSNFAAHFICYFDIITTGSYGFGLESNDGSILKIDGDTVIDNNGVKINNQLIKAYGSVELTPGRHVVTERHQAVTTFFTAIPHTESGGIITLDRTGRVCLFHVDGDNYVGYVKNSMGNLQLAIRIASDTGLAGAGDVFNQRFKQLMSQGMYAQAAKLAAEAPGGALRTAETIQALQNYQFLLKKVSLNELESLGLCQRILTTKQIQPARPKGRIEQFLKEKKLTGPEKLGDLLAPHDAKLALLVYTQVQSHQKVALCLIQLGQADKIVTYAKSVNWTPVWGELLAHVQQMRRDDVKTLAQHLVDQSYLNADDIVNILLGRGRNGVEKCTEFLLDYLQARGDRPEDAALQTKLLEINLQAAPQVARAILESDDCKFTNYDKGCIARLCESGRLFQFALQFYESLDDIKRVLQMGLGTNSLKADFLLKCCGDLTPEDAISCLRDMLQYGNNGANMQLVVEVAKRYSEFLTMEKLIGLFEEFESWSGLYLFLGTKVNTTQDTNVVFKYIQAAVEVGQFQQVELICRENDDYDPEEVKTFLIESNKIKDPRPLIHVCDRRGFVDELTNHLYTNQLYEFIEVYVTRMNPGATPKVVGSLLDLNAPEDQIRNLINSVRPPQCPVGELVGEVEKRLRLTLLLSWLEARFHEGLEDPELHNALAKIYIDVNNNLQHFLMTNKFYDSKVVGEYCELRDPHFAFIAYKRAWGPCDKELVAVTNKHGFFKDQARYCVERQDADLWEMVLNEENEHRQSLIDQVVSTALPELRDPEEVSCTVKAFMTADLPNELIELLERIVLSNSALTNLLILTAIKADPTRVTGYIDRLDNYDGPDLAKICISETYKLYEEEFLIYEKFQCGVEAVNVLLDDLKDLDRGAEFAAYWDKPDVWSILGRAQLDTGNAKDSIESFLKAEDAQYYQDVIIAANEQNEQNEFEKLIGFLQMALSKVRDNAYAKVEDLAALERFIGQPEVDEESEFFADLDEIVESACLRNIVAFVCMLIGLFTCYIVLIEIVVNFLGVLIVCLAPSKKLFEEAPTFRHISPSAVYHGKHDPYILQYFSWFSRYISQLTNQYSRFLLFLVFCFFGSFVLGFYAIKKRLFGTKVSSPVAVNPDEFSRREVSSRVLSDFDDYGEANKTPLISYIVRRRDSAWHNFTLFRRVAWRKIDQLVYASVFMRVRYVEVWYEIDDSGNILFTNRPLQDGSVRIFDGKGYGIDTRICCSVEHLHFPVIVEFENDDKQAGGEVQDVSDGDLVAANGTHHYASKRTKSVIKLPCLDSDLSRHDDGSRRRFKIFVQQRFKVVSFDQNGIVTQKRIRKAPWQNNWLARRTVAPSWVRSVKECAADARNRKNHRWTDLVYIGLSAAFALEKWQVATIDLDPKQKEVVIVGLKNFFSTNADATIDVRTNAYETKKIKRTAEEVTKYIELRTAPGDAVVSVSQDEYQNETINTNNLDAQSGDSGSVVGDSRTGLARGPHNGWRFFYDPKSGRQTSKSFYTKHGCDDSILMLDTSFKMRAKDEDGEVWDEGTTPSIDFVQEVARRAEQINDKKGEKDISETNFTFDDFDFNFDREAVNMPSQPDAEVQSCNYDTFWFLVYATLNDVIDDFSKVQATYEFLNHLFAFVKSLYKLLKAWLKFKK